MLSKERFLTLFSGMCRLTGTEMNEGLLEIYYNAVKDFTDEQFETAINHFINEKKYRQLPMPAELREYVFGKPEDRALESLTKVEEAMRKHGAYATVIFDDPVIHAVISTFEGSWTGICSMPENEWKFKKKEFVNLYRVFAKNKDRVMNAPKKLVGLHEHNNYLNGYDEHIPEPVMIGEKEKIEQWLALAEKYQLEQKDNYNKAKLKEVLNKALGV